MPEAQVKIMDFSAHDRMVFNVSEADLTITTNQRSTFITSGNGFSAQLVGYAGFSFNKYALFEDFNAI